MSRLVPTPTLTTADELDTIALTASPTPGETLVSMPENSSLQPIITPLPTPCNEVVLQLSTTLVVNYDTFYSAIPIASFQPTYRSFGDGSLISAPFDEDLQSANLSLLIIGSLATVFLRNIFVSYNYIRRGKVKKKTLFYILLASQLLAPLSIFPVIVSYFFQRINCTWVVHISYIVAMISLGLLITGILGIKAYKCLENPRILLIVLALLQLAASTFVVLDVIMTKGARRLTGSCVQVSTQRFTRYFVSAQFFQSLLICLCFVYACYKSRGSPASRGRMSVRLSLDDMPLQMPPNEDDANPQSRGWWDYVPEAHPDTFEEDKTEETIIVGKKTFRKKLGAVPSHIIRFLGTREQRRRYRPYDSPSYEPKDPRVAPRGNDLHNIPNESTGGFRGGHSPALSVGSRFSRIIPRISLLRKVVKDELLYTTFITSTCVVVAILAVIGLNFKTSLSVTGWISLNWAVISLLTVHSFGRVVHRHEREAWIQQSASRSIRIATTYSARQNSRRPHTRTPSLLPRNRSLARYHGDPSDPYSDTQPLDQERFSWKFGTVAQSPTALPPGFPLLLSVRNVTSEKAVDQEFEFERAPAIQRNVSWQTVSTANRI